MKLFLRSTFGAPVVVVNFLVGCLSWQAHASSGFAWKMLSGDFSTASNWTTNDRELEVPGSDDHTARIPPRAGDSVSFPDGLTPFDAIRHMLGYAVGTAEKFCRFGIAENRCTVGPFQRAFGLRKSFRDGL